ncbi:MAG: HAMP domain-containing protein [Roseofilum sp. SID2]|uniref:sensor histidine kinase n=1 Tax=unclassified Roseofilum TaxID=2620099 RepID=UPI001B15BBB9|nr:MULTISPECIES: ATP-binding protein [unclassified Roseofilum]MBP0014692.1 HAMP domain-containing protein [Roseofilum sp. SID3]MBP0024342.1 HAMP domain-containing protein [Roseofilum sp. SID2]MBP0038139.1 HAMP domain-containing protein [Roseofilum sp. SID1]
MNSRKTASRFLRKNLFVRTYSKFPLQQKISVPFIFTFLGLWILGTVSIGYYFLNYLERRQLIELEGMSGLMLKQFQDEIEALRVEARLIVEAETIRKGIENLNKNTLLQHLLPLKFLLKVDLIQAIDIQKKILIDFKINSISNSKVNNEVAISQVINGVSLSTIVSAEDKSKSNHMPSAVLIGTAPIKSNQGIIGGIILGRIINSDFLSEIAQKNNVSIVAFQKDKIIASSLPEFEKCFWLPPPQNSLSNFEESIVKIGNRAYLGTTVTLPGIYQSQLQLVIISSLEGLEKTQKVFLIRLFLFSLVGLTVAIIVGYFVSKLIVFRITFMTEVTQKIAYQNLWFQLPVYYNDELDRLAHAFNVMSNKLQEKEENMDNKLKAKVEQLEETLQELHLTQAQLIQSEKMSSLGQMIAGIAHEFNNPVNFISANIQPALDYVEDLLSIISVYQQECPQSSQTMSEIQLDIDLDFLVEDFRNLLSSIKSGAERITTIVRSLRTFSRLDEVGVKLININENLDSTLLILQHKIRETGQAGTIPKREIKITKDYKRSPWLTCNPGQLNQVFLNLVTNAIDALDELRSDRTNSKIPQISFKIECTDRSSVQITISDNGCGISEEVQNKIFDPFFTTKPIGSGTGLGLSISYSIIVDRCGGTLKCHSTPGVGTEFIIELPLEE